MQAIGQGWAERIRELWINREILRFLGDVINQRDVQAVDETNADTRDLPPADLVLPYLPVAAESREELAPAGIGCKLGYHHGARQEYDDGTGLGLGSLLRGGLSRFRHRGRVGGEREAKRQLDVPNRLLIRIA